MRALSGSLPATSFHGCVKGGTTYKIRRKRFPFQQRSSKIQPPTIPTPTSRKALATTRIVSRNSWRLATWWSLENAVRCASSSAGCSCSPRMCAADIQSCNKPTPCKRHLGRTQVLAKRSLQLRHAQCPSNYSDGFDRCGLALAHLQFYPADAMAVRHGQAAISQSGPPKRNSPGVVNL